MSFYLLEIGTEELPSAFVPVASKYLAEEASKQLAASHLPYKEIRSGGTPRRVYLYIDGMPVKQEDREEIVQGPPAKIAFNEDGSVSEVGLKFAKSKALDINSLTKASTDKGDYLSGIKKIDGLDTSELLADMAANIVKTIPFAKSMRWSSKEIRFARPLKYLLSIWDGNILHLPVDEIDTVGYTTGHRFLSPENKVIKDFDSYKKALEGAYVIVDADKRKEEISRQIDLLAKNGGYEADRDEALLETVTNLVEYPHAIEGQFEEEFLELPSPVLITSMKHHQKYFPTYKNGKLQNRFIGISNMKPENDSLIRGGYERVLRARLSDALFFFNNDKKVKLEERVEMLKKVVYQEKLGTSYEKMERFRALGEWIAGQTSPQSKTKVTEAATLAKADLMCEMVYEFPELQGFMGKIYAGIQGKDSEIALSIEEHYLPRFAGDALPATDTGRIVALADKLDTIVGAFSVGMIPTGNVDPYGLRRNAIGIINILDDADWRIPLKSLIAESARLVKPKATMDIDETIEKVETFFIQRHKQLMLSRGETDADAYDAAAALFDDFISQKAKAAALTKAKKFESFNSISQSFKRINNILKKNGKGAPSVDASLFEETEEKELFGAYEKLKSKIEACVKEEKWEDAVKNLTNFASPLDAFFDKVMVMAKDDKVRDNRLSLLEKLRQLFITVGDLSEII